MRVEDVEIDFFEMIYSCVYFRKVFVFFSFYFVFVGCLRLFIVCFDVVFYSDFFF